MNYEKQLEFVRWCVKLRRVEGMAYCHPSGKRGRLIVDAEATRDRITFLPDQGIRIWIDIDVIAENLRGFADDDLKQLLEEYRHVIRNPPKNTAGPASDCSGFEQSIRLVNLNSAVGKSELYTKIDEHIHLLMDPRHEDLPLFLKRVEVEFLSYDWIKNLRNTLKGRSRRRSRRQRTIELIELEISQEVDVWWGSIESKTPQIILAHIDRIPSRFVDVGIDMLIAARCPDDLILIDRMWSFFGNHFDRVVFSIRESVGPSGISYAAHLIKERKLDECRTLLSRFRLKKNSPFEPFVSFLKFVLEQSPQFSGETRFEQMQDHDLYLSACYAMDAMPINEKLMCNRQWSFKVIRGLFDAPRDVHNFLVFGVQPRIAELSFKRLWNDLFNEDLKDLNEEAVAGRISIMPPSTQLPKADFEDHSGAKFDVKSNLYFKSMASKVGLRGLFIKRSTNKVRYAGIVFHGVSKTGCQWDFIGNFSFNSFEHLCREIAARDDRVVPFVFEMPVKFRCSFNLSPESTEACDKVVVDDVIRFAWAIATARILSGNAWSTNDAGLITWFLKRNGELLKSYPIEYCMWRALTEATLKGCSSGMTTEAEQMLDLTLEVLRLRILPVRIQCVGGEPILAKWIDSVLKPIVSNYHHLCCPYCTSRDFQVELKCMTAGGAILGTMKCAGECRSNDLDATVTILTHCYKCKSYPIMIGLDHVCASCRGLICTKCGSCKKGCPETRDSTALNENK